MLAGMLVLTSCFKDEGNYDYEDLNAPHWLYSENSLHTILARLGENVVFDASKLFVWDKDSALREQEVRYEWIINDKVVGTGKHFEISTVDLMNAAGIKDFSQSGSGGTPGIFAVVEKATGIKYMGKFQVHFSEKYTNYDWVVMTDKGSTTDVSVVSKKTETVNGENIEVYNVVYDAYGAANNGEKIPGRPISMHWAFDKHISSQGSITVITDQGGYELMGSSMILYSKIDGEQFLDGMPANFNLLARADCDGNSDGQSAPGTFLATQDGQLYSRLMSKNYLGGKYLTEPYYVDEKGYKVSWFGNTIYSTPMTPCYDEKNRRVMIASVLNEQVEVVDDENNKDYIFVSKANIKPLQAAAPQVAVQNMPEGTEVLYLGVTNHVPNFTYGHIHYTMVYNLPNESHTRVSDFAVNTRTIETNTNEKFSASFQLDNVPKLTASSKILSSGASPRSITPGTSFAGKIMYYTVNNEIYKVIRTPKAGKPQLYELKSFEMPEGVNITSNITCLALAFDCDELIVGCENGDLFVFDIKIMDEPKLAYQGNLGGKVMAAQQLGSRAPSADRYNN